MSFPTNFGGTISLTFRTVGANGFGFLAGLAKHLTAEVKTEEFVAGKGVVVKWERIRRQNHWLDALAYACAAGHVAGVRLVAPAPKPKVVTDWFKQQEKNSGSGHVTRPDGSPWINFDRWNEMGRRYFG